MQKRPAQRGAFFPPSTERGFTMHNNNRRLAGLGLLCALLTGCGAPQSVRADFYAMDTFMTVTVYDNRQSEAAALGQQIEGQINTLDRALSRQRAESEITAVNTAGGQPVTVSADTYAAVERAVAYAAWTDGAYDPTTAPLSDLWGIGTETAAVPTQDAIDAALTHVGWRNVVLLPDHQIQLQNGAQLDLGGIGKGWATDHVAALCGQADEVSVLAQLGGNILGYGANPTAQDGLWSVGVADPDNTAEVIAVVRVQGQSVVTSGDYERFFEQDGRRYHHIFDPATGRPADSGLRSVTVVDADSSRADALTTALFVMGLEDGLAFAEQNGIEALFVTDTREVVASSALHSRVEFRGQEAGYTYA